MYKKQVEGLCKSEKIVIKEDIFKNSIDIGYK